MFPIVREKKPKAVEHKIQKFLPRNTWIRIALLIVVYLFNLAMSNLILSLFMGFYPPIYRDIVILCGYIVYNLSFFPLLFVLIPKVFRLPYGKQPIGEYLSDIKLSWLEKLYKYIFWVMLGLVLNIALMIIVNIPNLPFMDNIINIDPFFLLLFYNSSIFFRQELIYRGVLLTVSLTKRRKFVAILLNGLIVTGIMMISMILSTLPYIGFLSPLQLILPIFIIFFLESIKAFLFVKTKSIIPGVLMQVILINLSPFFVLPSNFY
jgi:hypothetical protein